MPTYTNPIARDGDFADPFVLRFNGRYYLYCTNADLRCWSSTDLLHWTLEGPAIAAGTFGDLVPFAPEVTYDNGVFHLYTSPSGTGHRILRSDRPTGPFVPVTGNLGHSIDGHVFVDDDGRRYFYWAGDEGVWGCEMTSPTDLGEPVLTGAFMHGWTEGPFVVKRDGRYHMTLTGNHYLSPGYRINAAVSDHPLHGYRDSPLNPILVSTAPGHLGLGHSSSVLGPDLVSTYLVYHNLNPDRTRDLNIDLQVWHGDLIEVLGPSRLAPAPAGPDHSTRWGADESRRWEVAGGSLVEQAELARLRGPAEVNWRDGSLPDCFTSEHTFSATAGSYGIVARDGERVGWRIEAGPENQLRALAFDGEETRTLAATGLPAGHRHDVLHCYRLVAHDGRVEVFLDNRRVLEFRPERIAGLRLGYHCGDGGLTLGYAALTRNVEQHAARAAARPVPGRFLPAAAGRGGDRNSRPEYVVSPGAEYRQPLLVAASREYDLQLTGDFPAGATVVAVDDELWELELSQAATTILARPVLTAGAHTLTVSSRLLPVTLREVSLSPTPPPAANEPRECSGTGKLLTGLATVGDWELTATVRVDFQAPDAHADLLFCASELAEGGEGDDTRLGIDFLLGYSLQFHRDRIVLARHAYDERQAAHLAAEVEPGISHPVTITRRGSTVTARVAGLDALVLDDPWPHSGGHLGLRTRDARIALAAVGLVALPWNQLRRVQSGVLASQTPGQPSR